MQPILKVDLSSKTISQFSVPSEWERDFLGGSALAARLLYDKLTPELEPFAPEAPLLFLNGPLSGTVGPPPGASWCAGARLPPGCGANRTAAVSGDPSCAWPVSTGCGSKASPRSRSICGSRMVKSKSVQPSTYGAWTLTRPRRRSKMSWRAGKVRVTSIGIAGEACLPFALILCDHGRVAGRTGMGALMGKKRLKAVAVQGHGKIPLADLATYTGLRSEANRMLRSDGQTQVLRELGTAGAADYFDYLHEMPKRYFHSGEPVEGLNISGAVVKDTILAGVSACHACVIACGGWCGWRTATSAKVPNTRRWSGLDRT